MKRGKIWDDSDDEEMPNKKQKTLSEKLAELTDPTPKKEIDPEKPDWDNTINIDQYVDEDHSKNFNIGFKNAPIKSILKSTGPSLGEAYRGKTTSRKELDSESEGEVVADDAERLKKLMESSEEDDEMFYRDNTDSEDSDEDEMMKALDKEEEDGFLNTLGRSKFQQVEQLEEYLKKKQHNKNKEEFPPEEQTEAPLPGAPEKITPSQDQQTKARHTLNQCKIWDSFVDMRIQLQGALESGNRLPVLQDYLLFLCAAPSEDDEMGEKIQDAYKEVTNDLQKILKGLTDIQAKLLQQNKQSKSLNYQTDNPLNWKTIENNQKILEKHFGPIADQWYTKTLLSSTITLSRFKTFNQSVTGQVDNILSGPNLETIIRRSRTLNDEIVKDRKIFGKLDNESNTPKENKDINYEVYNDLDFYSSMVKEHIMSGRAEIDPDDTVALTQQYLLARKMNQNKTKKKYNNHQKKDRLIEYRVHDKLASFMAPLPRYPKQDSYMANELFRSIMGQKIENRGMETDIDIDLNEDNEQKTQD